MNSVEKLASKVKTDKAKTGIWGLDNILSGGFSRGHVFLVEGAPGTGKTTMAKEAVKAVQTLSGRSVIVLAPSSAAVQTLKDSSFREADTLANFQDKDYLQDRARGQILWIDEAGLLSAKQMRWAIDFASHNACRVILSGDTRQHHSSNVAMRCGYWNAWAPSVRLS